MAPKRKNTAVEEPQTSLAIDWNALTIANLKAELSQRGLPVSGTKPVLVNRLEVADEEAREAVAASEPTDWSSLTIAQLKVELGNRGLPVSGNKTTLIDRLNVADDEPAAAAPKAKRARAAPKNEVSVASGSASAAGGFGPGGEVRLRPFVEGPDAEYNKKLKKIQKERLFMLDRNRHVDKDGYMCETFDIAGSTGNVYQTTIGRSPKCVCMDAVSLPSDISLPLLMNIQRIRGQKCKHINYALVIILKAPANLCYQLAFLSTELELIFTNAPVTRAPELGHQHDDDDTIYNGKRKPIEGECPICVFDMEPGEEIVWCKAACGQNFHKECFDQWKRSKNGGHVTCVYCRSEWQEDVPNPGSLANLKNMAPKIGRYQNVAHLLPQYQQAK
ncbi:hypothetical protein G7Y89_g9350 [Cudoniella acicularis]|uniref:Postreplication repair E3 ubiquitin-protein ligase RAD18 n=1 Tax=Cudoniella acicularis TaxID=354080 RepID=A0A8H4RH18_9HELO|nr:hypothetical protein G7Y89_g9350 [Cudoniella acicularis]